METFTTRAQLAAQTLQAGLVVNVLGDGVATVYVAKVENQINVKTYNHATWLE